MLNKKEEKSYLVHYFLLSLFSVLAVAIGCFFTTRNSMLFTGQTTYGANFYLTKVDVILGRDDTEVIYSGDETMINTDIRFTCTCICGERKGESFVATQVYDDLSGRMETPVEEGDWIFVYNTDAEPDSYLAGNFFRIIWLAILFAVMVIFLMLFAKAKGLATIVSLGLTIASLFLVFVPAILSGYNVYLWTMLVCAYSIVITPLYIGGFNRKSLASIVGCISGVALASILTIVLNNVMKISGVVTEEDMFVIALLEDPIDMRAITFAAVLIGALGSTMDVSMSIAASVWEMHDSTGKNDFRSLLNSGFNIGRDILGTQISTLVMAYIGSSLCTVLLYVAYQPSAMQMINVEAVIVELLDALVGAATIILTIPLTAVVSAAMLTGAKSSASSKEKKTVFKLGQDDLKQDKDDTHGEVETSSQKV